MCIVKVTYNELFAYLQIQRNLAIYLKRQEKQISGQCTKILELINTFEICKAVFKKFISASCWSCWARRSSDLEFAFHFKQQ